MKKRATIFRYVTLTVIFTMLGIVMADAKAPEDDHGPEVGGLVLSISATPDVVEAKQPITLTLTVKNVSDKQITLVVTRFPAVLDFVINVIGESGEPAALTEEGQHANDKDLPRSSTEISLEPGMTRLTKVVINRLYDMPAGKYAITVTRMIPKPAGKHDELQSNKLKVVVK